MKQNKKLLTNWLRFLLIILLVLGVFFRFFNLDRKAYWRDEAATLLRISGYTQAEVLQQVYDGREISVEELRKYQRPNPEKGLADTIRSLAIEDAQHPPLYYTIAWFWAKWFGSSPTAIRSLSALISLLVFPCVYWLCLELFESSLIGWVAIALIAVSLVHVAYAQEAREFSLWIVTILLSSAALLQAMRLTTKLSWVIYAGTVALGLYTLPLTGLVTIAHGIYVFAIDSEALATKRSKPVQLSRCQLSQTFIDYLLASGAGLIAFTPWMFIFLSRIPTVIKTTNWVQKEVEFSSLFESWLINIHHAFADEKFNLNWPIAVLVSYSIYFLCRTTPKRVWLFILTLIGVPALALILPDLILGGVRSTIVRYTFPCYLGIQLAVAYLFATQVTSKSINFWWRKLWQIVAIALITVAVWSCANYSQTTAAWNKGDRENLAIASFVNQVPHSLLISDVNEIKYRLDTSIHSLLSLSHLLNSNVKVQLVIGSNPPTISSKFSNVFLFTRYEVLQRTMAQKYNRKSVLVQKGKTSLWKLL